MLLKFWSYNSYSKLGSRRSQTPPMGAVCLFGPRGRATEKKTPCVAGCSGPILPLCTEFLGLLPREEVWENEGRVPPRSSQKSQRGSQGGGDAEPRTRPEGRRGSSYLISQPVALPGPRASPRAPASPRGPSSPGAG